MKKSLLSFAIVTIVATTLFSCKSNSSSSEEKPVAEAVETVYQVDDVLQNGDTLAGKVIEIEGVCTHICKHGGRKIFLMGSDDKNTIRIESGDLGAFDQKCVNNIVKVNGTLVEDRIDEAYLQKWEENIKNKTTEEHGDDEGGCATEKKARGESAASNTEQGRIDAFRKRIAEQKEKTGKDYLSFFYIQANDYTIQD